ncbi:MAG: hypothetical protein JEZ07_10725 [Phycisphaerae bacterium]|nr:hypothetical protein [Phycisphaerae bacterium]
MSNIVNLLLPSLFLVNTVMAVLPGSGTQAQPWRIENINHFNEFTADSNYWNGYVQLETDLALGSYATAVIAPDTDQATTGFQGTAFTGVFDGMGHCITTLKIDHNYPPLQPDYDYLGFFGKIDTGALVKNLSIGKLPYDFGNVAIDISVFTGHSTECVGALAGENKGAVLNCSAVARVLVGADASQIGGLIGNNLYGKVIQCHSFGMVQSDADSMYVGGLIGKNYASSAPVIFCYSGSEVKVRAGSQYAGGLIGANQWSQVTKCFATGDVGPYFTTGGNYIGGLIGYNSNSSNVNNSYALGTVKGNNYVGGLVGRHTYSGIRKCFATGTVTGASKVGGLVGDSDDGDPDVYDSFWDKDTSGTTTSDGGTTKSSQQMRQQETFTNWDFNEFWQITQNQTYPNIRFYNQADINHDGIVDINDFAIIAANWLEEN